MRGAHGSPCVRRLSVTLESRVCTVQCQTTTHLKLGKTPPDIRIGVRVCICFDTNQNHSASCPRPDSSIRKNKFLSWDDPSSSRPKKIGAANKQATNREINSRGSLSKTTAGANFWVFVWKQQQTSRCRNRSTQQH